MAKVLSCNCGNGKAATEKVQVSVRIMGEFRSEVRTLHFCPECAEAMRG